MQEKNATSKTSIIPQTRAQKFCPKNCPAKKTPIVIFSFFYFFYKVFFENVRKGVFENVFHNIFIKSNPHKTRPYRFYTQNVYFEFCPRICPKMSETSKFCPKIKKFLSENVREHKKPPLSTHATNRAVICFHKKNCPKKSKSSYIYKIKSSNENL